MRIARLGVCAAAMLGLFGPVQTHAQAPLQGLTQAQAQAPWQAQGAQAETDSQQPQGKSWRIIPTIGLIETYTDNIGLTSEDTARRGWITDLVPGIQLNVNTARLKAWVDYRHHYLQYSDSTFGNSRQNSLSSSLTFEAIEKWLFVDASAGIVGQSRSPFGGAVSVDRPTISGNRLETQTVQVSPYIRGQFSDVAAYQARYNFSDVRTDGEVIPTTHIGELAARVRNASVSAKIGWAIDVNVLNARNDLVGNVDDSRVRGSIIYGIDPLFHVSASYGYESTDFLGPGRDTSDNPGLGLTWTPSQRLQVGAIVERRFFGTGHSALIAYKTASTVWRLQSTRDAQVLPALVSSTAATNSLYGLLNDLLTATIPDPVERAAAARRKLEDTGISVGFPVATGVLTARPTIYAGLTASVAMLRPRDTFSATATRLEQQPANTTSLIDNITDFGKVREVGFTASWAHKLTPSTTVTATATTLRAQQLTLTQLATRDTLFDLYVTTKLGPRGTASFGIRHAQFDAPASLFGYRENAIFGAFTFKL